MISDHIKRELDQTVFFSITWSLTSIRLRLAKCSMRSSKLSKNAKNSIKVLGKIKF